MEQSNDQPKALYFTEAMICIGLIVVAMALAIIFHKGWLGIVGLTAAWIAGRSTLAVTGIYPRWRDEDY
ncbi:MAG: hypothetical protein R3B84_00975 [Zavarzinella sp.]